MTIIIVFLGSLDYALFDANENVAKHAVVSRLSSQLSCDTVCFVNRIKFASDILIDCAIN